MNPQAEAARPGRVREPRRADTAVPPGPEIGPTTDGPVATDAIVPAAGTYGPVEQGSFLTRLHSPRVRARPRGGRAAGLVRRATQRMTSGGPPPQA